MLGGPIWILETTFTASSLIQFPINPYTYQFWEGPRGRENLQQIQYTKKVFLNLVHMTQGIRSC